MKLKSKSWVKMQAFLDLTRTRIMLLGVLLLSNTSRSLVLGGDLYFPPTGKNIENQDKKTPQEVGLNPAVAQRINEYISENIPKSKGETEMGLVATRSACLCGRGFSQNHRRGVPSQDLARHDRRGSH
jgi:hypothetical protein